MSVIAVVGTFDDMIDAPISGNGKTLSVTHYLYQDFLEGAAIYSNFETSFGKKLRTIDMFNRVKKGQIEEGSSIAIDELTKILNSMGAKSQDVLFSEGIVGQLRKFDIDLYWTGQRFKSAVNRIRYLTNIVLIAYKTHLDETPCYEPRCKKEHYIWVFSQIPFIEKHLVRLTASEVGKLYNTKEFIDDELNIPSEKMKLELAKLSGETGNEIKIGKKTYYIPDDIPPEMQEKIKQIFIK